MTVTPGGLRLAHPDGRIARMSVSRRQFMAGASGAVAATWLAGCGGFSKSDSSSGSSSKAGTITFQTWASDAEASAFKRLAKDFEAKNKGTKVDLKIVPYAEMFTGIDASLQAGTAPDVFRVDYTTLGLYSST